MKQFKGGYMYNVNDYCRELFGKKVYKIALNAGMTCPNRDGTCGTRGCIFCSTGGSGDFAEDPRLPLDEQIEAAKTRVRDKFHGDQFIAYFQAYTNTYAPPEHLEKLFFPVIERDDIAALSIATRPDCLSYETIAILDRLNRIKPVWVELGLQTIHPCTAEYIRRGYELSVYDEAVKALKSINVHVITHIILGLPGESAEDMKKTAEYVVRTYEKEPCKDRIHGGIKLQLLHVLKGTDLADDYEKGNFKILSLEEYTDILCSILEIIPDDIVIHRLTGDGPKKLLIAPLWSADKKKVINTINKAIRERGL